MSLRRHTITISAVLVSASATVFVAMTPGIDFAYRRPALHISLETAAFLIALLTSFLVFGRFLRSRDAADLVLVAALAALAGANLVATLSALAESTSRFDTWAPIGGRVLGSALFTAAAFMPTVRLRRPRAAALAVLLDLGVVLAGIAALVALLGTTLPVGVETAPNSDPGRPDLDGHPVVLGTQLVTMAMFALAALGFSARVSRTGDELLRWLALGAVFACFARVNYFLYPSLYTDWVYTGDVFRLLFYVSLLVGAAREIRSYWEDAAHSAVLEERRRIARDLHDGAAQELSFILRRLRRVDELDEAILAPVVAAAERGLDDSRRAIDALSRPLDEPLDTALSHAVERVAARTGIRLVLDISENVHVSPEVREGLIRIACEAVNNAANHSGASFVKVELDDADDLRLRVEDDGSGFDPARVVAGARGGFGLTAMRERAEELGAGLTIDTSLGGGTRIEVVMS